MLERIETVGEGDMENVPRLPGTGPAYISHDGAETLRAGAAGIARGGGGGGGGGGEGDYQDTVKAGGEVGGGGGVKMPPASEEYVRGTTWVFDDGSQVILRADGEGKQGAGEEGGGGGAGGKGGRKGGGRGGVGADDDDFYDDFEKLTKGENFKDGDA